MISRARARVCVCVCVCVVVDRQIPRPAVARRTGLFFAQSVRLIAGITPVDSRAMPQPHSETVNRSSVRGYYFDLRDECEVLRSACLSVCLSARSTSVSCRRRTRATRCVTANVLQTKVDAQSDKLEPVELS